MVLTAEQLWVVVGCVIGTIHIFRKMNRSPRVAVALWWRRGWPPTHMRPPPMIPSPPPPSLAFSSPASAGGVRGMATRADGFPQTAAAPRPRREWI